VAVIDQAPCGQEVEEAEEEARVHGARHAQVPRHQGQVVGRQRVGLRRMYGQSA